ncbi:MAG: HAD family hydrolase [Spirochaetota bacterium]
MQYRGIIFDKDGTLFDYYEVWGPVFRLHVNRILTEFEREHDDRLRKRLLYLLGIGNDGINSNGLIFQHNGALMLLRLFVFSKKNRLPYRRLIHLLTEGYFDSKEQLNTSLLEMGNEATLLPLFKALKEAGYYIGVVTSDNAESTDVSLQHFGIKQYVDMISTYDDHLKSKPHPESFDAFCEAFSLKPSEVVVVGDAPVDMKYARKGGAGYIIGVMSGSGDRRRLTRIADVLYPTVLSLFDDPKLALQKQT